MLRMELKGQLLVEEGEGYPVFVLKWFLSVLAGLIELLVEQLLSVRAWLRHQVEQQCTSLWSRAQRWL